jgi:hypothetical protein
MAQTLITTTTTTKNIEKNVNLTFEETGAKYALSRKSVSVGKSNDSDLIILTQASGGIIHIQRDDAEQLCDKIVELAKEEID